MEVERLKDLDTRELKNYGESYDAFVSFLLNENSAAVCNFIKTMSKQTDTSNLWKLKNKFKTKMQKHKLKTR